MNLGEDSKNLLKKLYNEINKEKEDQEKREAKHGDLFWAVFQNSSNQRRESPVLIISDDGDTEDVVILKGTKNVNRPLLDVELNITFVNKNHKTIHKQTAFRTNKITTINRSQLDNRCTYDWKENPNKKEELSSKLKVSLGLK
ncbi:MAG: type II toxin-antitoxin system PemK/MazF family toxin [Bacillota bacterium]|jgi:predicted double-glycine peptidase